MEIVSFANCIIDGLFSRTAVDYAVRLHTDIPLFTCDTSTKCDFIFTLLRSSRRYSFLCEDQFPHPSSCNSPIMMDKKKWDSWLHLDFKTIFTTDEMYPTNLNLTLTKCLNSVWESVSVFHHYCMYSLGLHTRPRGLSLGLSVVKIWENCATMAETLRNWQPNNNTPLFHFNKHNNSFCFSYAQLNTTASEHRLSKHVCH